ncbi:MAG: cupin domain-containing protein [Hyphomicrobiales bacterium]|nr:cupin domain-containing protein [Hyphomicrobiales bacterium]
MAIFRSEPEPGSDAGPALVVGPSDGDTYWQPVPANGFVRNILNQATVGGAANFSMGTQTVAPGCFIREHTHAMNEEIIHVVDGRGVARIDGVEHPIQRGSTVYIGRNRKHHFLNPFKEPMTFLWLMMPGGLDRFFAEIGRARTPGEKTPDPFPRPDNVAEIERRTVFGWTDTSYDKKR